MHMVNSGTTETYCVWCSDDPSHQQGEGENR